MKKKKLKLGKVLVKKRGFFSRFVNPDGTPEEYLELRKWVFAIYLLTLVVNIPTNWKSFYEETTYPMLGDALLFAGFTVAGVMAIFPAVVLELMTFVGFEQGIKSWLVRRNFPLTFLLLGMGVLGFIGSYVQTKSSFVIYNDMVIGAPPVRDSSEITFIRKRKEADLESAKIQYKQGSSEIYDLEIISQNEQIKAVEAKIKASPAVAVNKIAKLREQKLKYESLKQKAIMARSAESGLNTRNLELYNAEAQRIEADAKSQMDMVEASYLEQLNNFEDQKFQGDAMASWITSLNSILNMICVLLSGFATRAFREDWFNAFRYYFTFGRAYMPDDVVVFYEKQAYINESNKYYSEGMSADQMYNLIIGKMNDAKHLNKETVMNYLRGFVNQISGEVDVKLESSNLGFFGKLKTWAFGTEEDAEDDVSEKIAAPLAKVEPAPVVEKVEYAPAPVSEEELRLNRVKQNIRNYYDKKEDFAKVKHIFSAAVSKEFIEKCWQEFGGK